MNVAVGLLIIMAIANLMLGVVVFARNWLSAVNRSFLALCLFVAGWAAGVAGFITNGTSVDKLLVFANLYYMAALGIAFALYVFSYAWSGQRIGRRVLHALPFASGWLFAIIVYHHAVISHITVDGSAITVKFNVMGQTIYSLVFLIFFGLALRKIIARQRHLAKKDAKVARAMALGILGAGIVGIFFNLVLPWFGNYGYIWIGPSFSFVFVAAVAYSIIRHRLFDIRFALTRTLAYVLSLAVLSGLYVLSVYLVYSVIISRDSSSTLQQVFNISLALVSALLLPPIKRFFDKVTNKLFYRNAYNPQLFIDDFNNAITSSIELKTLINEISITIEGYIKPEFLGVFIPETEDKGPRKLGTIGNHELSSAQLATLMEALDHLPSKSVVVDYLQFGKRSSELRGLLNKNEIAAALKLPINTGSIGGNGYVFLGYKKSGNAYSKQDAELLEIITNELVIAVQNALRFEEIQLFNATLEQKISDATSQLRRTNDKLKALDETKDDFISMASHQLRTPLTSVKGYLSLVLEGDAGKITPMQRKMLGQAFISSQRMVYLIADLLNVSRLKTGKFIIDSAPVNLAEVVQQEMRQLVETAQSRDLTLIYDKPEHFPAIQLDETKTRQVIMNFIDNAIYYTPAGGHIEIKLTETEKSVELLIIDDGIGVPKADQPHLFTKFYRAPNAQRARPDGTGLGLYMAKKVVVAQNGAIIFSSKEGKGSTFGFTFAKNR